MIGSGLQQQITNMNTKEFEYLKQPSSLYQLTQRDSKSLFSTQFSQNLQRHFFMGQEFTAYEKQQIRLFRIFLEKQHFDPQGSSLTEDCLCRFLYSEGFHFRETSQKIKKYVEWMHNPSIQTLTETTKRIMNSGCIYTFGRDKKSQPVIYVRLALINLRQNQIEKYFTVFNAIVGVVIQYLFIKGVVETYTVVIDAEGVNLSKMPIDRVLQAIKLLTDVFPMLLGALYVINSTKLMQIFTSTISNFLKQSTKMKITFFSSKQSQNLTKYIDNTNLQKRYQGQHSNLIVFWPPSLPKHIGSTQYTSIPGQDLDDSAYFSVNERDQIFFRNTSIESDEKKTLEVCCDKNCTIF